MKSAIWFLVFTVAFGSKAQNVSFAERNLADSGTNVYFDQFGMLYPPVKIKTQEFESSHFSIQNYYETHSELADSLFKSYHIDTKEPPFSHSAYQQLNDSLIFDLSQKIQSELNERSLVFGIHGYRKSYLQQEQDVTSVDDFNLLDLTLEQYKSSDYKLVNVYWDATYDCCYSMNRKKNAYLFELFELAYQRADSVGESFQTFLSFFNQKQIGIVAHSLGSKVAVTSVINATNRQTNYKVVLIEPAISAELIKNEYALYTSHPNISWLIYYNENDFVLQKKDNKIGVFGPGSNAYGETTLGINKKRSAENLQKWMSNSMPAIPCELVDMSELGKVHSWRYYIATDEFKKCVEFLTTNY